MFTTLKVRLLPALILIFFSTAVLIAQDAEKEMAKIEESAIQNFSKGEYEASLALYNRLLLYEPGNALFSYYAGACMVQSDQNLGKAIELLHFASSKKVPADVYFYLGEAYRKQYNFKQAKSNFLKFEREASRLQTKEKDTKLLVRSADEANLITISYNPVEVLEEHNVDFNNPKHYEQLGGKGGALTRKPASLFSEKEQTNGLNSLMFLPEKISRGQTVYFSGIHGFGNDGFQIMQAKRGKKGKWTDISPVESLNTDRNEILPYFDPVGMDMYFASDGYAGLGGYDIYRSHYDEENGKWLSPENIGFPLNSVYDDYILIPGTDLGMLMIVTARNIRDTALTAYWLNVIEPRQSLANASPKEIQKIANFGFEEIHTEPKIMGQNEMQNETVSKPEINTGNGGKTDLIKSNVASGSLINKKEKKSETNKNDENSSKGLKYRKMISSALTYQSMADSLAELSSHAAIMVRKLEDPDDRWVYQKNIILWNKRADQHRHKADSVFSLISEYELSMYSETIEKDTIINEMIVYKYKTDKNISEKAKQAFRSQDNSDQKQKDSANSNIVNAPSSNSIQSDETAALRGAADESLFQIFEKPVYSDDKPIGKITVPGKGASYRIQIAVFSKLTDNNEFGGIFPLYYEVVSGRNLYRYYAGNFRKFSDTEIALKKIRDAGYTDAFIVAWYNGEKMSFEKVRKLEK